MSEENGAKIDMVSFYVYKEDYYKLTSLDGDKDGALFGLFEGVWLGVVVGCEMNKLRGGNRMRKNCIFKSKDKALQ